MGLLLKNCAGSHVGILNSVEIIGCYVNDEECEFRRGMCITLTINFTPCEYGNSNMDYYDLVGADTTFKNHFK